MIKTKKQEEDTYMTMKKLHNGKRVLVAIMLVAMLIPMLALSVYASSKYPYNFTFNFNGGTKYCYGTKTDTGYSAGASINSSNFGGGNVRFQLQRSGGSDLSYWAGPYGSNGNYTLYYYSNVDLSQPPISVRLAGTATSAVGYISGNFQP